MARKRLGFMMFAQLSFSGCFMATPFQSARTAEPGRRHGSVSMVHSQPKDGTRNYGWEMMEFGTRIPVDSTGVDLGINGAFISQAGSHGRRFGGVMFGIGTKLEVIDDVLAFEFPMRIMYASVATLHTTHFYPRAILSVPVADNLELNLSATRFFTAGGLEHTPWGYSAGLALGRPGGVIIRPEIGVLDYPRGDDMLQFGIGITPEFEDKPPAATVDLPPDAPLPPATDRTPY